MTQCHQVGLSERTHKAFLGQPQLTRAFRLPGTFLAVLAVCFAAGLAATHAAAPTLQPLLPAKWPSSGNARGVAVSGHYAYVADYTNGLQVIDVRNPATCVRVGGYNTSGFARDVAVSGNYAYVADDTAGLQVIDVSNPANCVRVEGATTPAGMPGAWRCQGTTPTWRIWGRACR